VARKFNTRPACFDPDAIDQIGGMLLAHCSSARYGCEAPLACIRHSR
jgi:hypothetical protein